MSGVCELLRPSIELWAEGELHDPPAVRRVARHLEGCAACRHHLVEHQAETRRIQSLLARAVGVARNPSSDREGARPPFGIGRIGASAEGRQRRILSEIARIPKPAFVPAGAEPRREPAAQGLASAAIPAVLVPWPGDPRRPLLGRFVVAVALLLVSSVSAILGIAVFSESSSTFFGGDAATNLADVARMGLADEARQPTDAAIESWTSLPRGRAVSRSRFPDTVPASSDPSSPVDAAVVVASGTPSVTRLRWYWPDARVERSEEPRPGDAVWLVSDEAAPAGSSASTASDPGVVVNGGERDGWAVEIVVVESVPARSRWVLVPVELVHGAGGTLEHVPLSAHLAIEPRTLIERSDSPARRVAPAAASRFLRRYRMLPSRGIGTQDSGLPHSLLPIEHGRTGIAPYPSQVDDDWGLPLQVLRSWGSVDGAGFPRS
jgi:hypothetical protein